MSDFKYSEHVDELVRYEMARLVELDKKFQFKNRKVAEAATILLDYYSNLGHDLAKKLKK